MLQRIILAGLIVASGSINAAIQFKNDTYQDLDVSVILENGLLLTRPLRAANNITVDTQQDAKALTVTVRSMGQENLLALWHNADRNEVHSFRIEATQDNADQQTVFTIIAH